LALLLESIGRVEIVAGVNQVVRTRRRQAVANNVINEFAGHNPAKFLNCSTALREYQVDTKRIKGAPEFRAALPVKNVARANDGDDFRRLTEPLSQPRTDRAVIHPLEW